MIKKLEIITCSGRQPIVFTKRLIKSWLPSLFFVVFILGCSIQGKEVSHEKLLAYLTDPDHGLIKENKTGDVEIKVHYKPSDLLFQQELIHYGTDPGKVDSLRKEYAQHVYFVLSVSKGGKELEEYYYHTQKDFSGAVTGLAFGMKEKFRIIAGQDTIPVLDYMAPRAYGATGSTTMMLVFPADRLVGEFKLLCSFPELNIYTKSFTFRREDLDEVPRLKIN